jgi:hypothetical protein
MRREADVTTDELRADEVPDVEVIASVRARELRFRTVPKVKVRFAGEPAFKATSWTERDNLPDQVEPGVTYRDVRVRWEARARILHPTDPTPRGE